MSTDPHEEQVNTSSYHEVYFQVMKTNVPSYKMNNRHESILFTTIDEGSAKQWSKEHNQFGTVANVHPRLKLESCVNQTAFLIMKLHAYCSTL